MRKILRVGFGLFGVFTLCALAAVPAIAGEFLVNGMTFTGSLNTETEGTLIWEKFNGEGSETELTAAECSGYFDGTFEGSKGRITAILNLEMGEIGTLISEDTAKIGMSCTVIYDAGGLADCKEGSLEGIWLVGINAQLGDSIATEMLLNGFTITDMISPNNNLGERVGYEVECETLIGVKGEESCTEVEAEAVMTNAATTPASILAVFSPTPVAMRGNCTGTGVHSLQILGEGSMWAIGAELERLETAVN